VDLEVHEGDLRVILGANGAGKSTIIRTILGLVKPKSGSIELAGQSILGLPPHKIGRMGVTWVPEGRQLWSSLTVLDNLRMGAFAQQDKEGAEARIQEMLKRFPRLGQRQEQLAGSLSGGEQQMLAIARALVTNPRLIMMDEPSLGLAPLVVKSVFQLIREINSAGVTVLMVEQNARQALGIANWAYLLEVGRMVTDGPAEQMSRSEVVQEVFLGGGI
jgi:branched-chain amino acid transport system ATP-binding protein